LRVLDASHRMAGLQGIEINSFLYGIIPRIHCISPISASLLDMNLKIISNPEIRSCRTYELGPRQPPTLSQPHRNRNPHPPESSVLSPTSRKKENKNKQYIKVASPYLPIHPISSFPSIHHFLTSHNTTQSHSLRVHSLQHHLLTLSLPLLNRVL